MIVNTTLHHVEKVITETSWFRLPEDDNRTVECLTTKFITTKGETYSVIAFMNRATLNGE